MAGEAAQKATVTLGGVPLAASGSIVWRFQTGVAPYRTVMSVHRDQWGQLASKLGKPVEFVIRDSRGKTTTVRDVYIMHVLPSPKPTLVSFEVADKRWLWPYHLIVRDYNVPKKTGERTALQQVPVENQVVVDQYRYRASSLNEEGKKWTAKQAVEDVLKLLEGEEGDSAETVPWVIESFPIKEGSDGGTGSSEDGSFSLQSVSLRDPGDVALARLLGYIPGAEVYVDQNGIVRVIDAADLAKTDAYVGSLPAPTWDGEKVELIDRKAIRPSKVFVYYQREVELLLEFEDDYAGETSADPPRNSPFLENVLPTVDPETRVFQYDPEINQTVEKQRLPPGTWVSVKEWLSIMDELRPQSSAPWTFETLKQLWMSGDLDGALGVNAAEDDPEAHVALRVQALKQHFRQTFRISRRYMERIRDLQPVRAAMLDPVTGARSPAAVWGQACMIPTVKGQLMLARYDESRSGVYRNLDMLKDSSESVIKTAPGPARVQIIDRDLGIIRVDWLLDPYGGYQAFTPGLLVGQGGSQPKVPNGDLEKQDTEPMGIGFRMAEGTNGLELSPKMKLKLLLTMIPGAPNNRRQLHRVEVSPSDVADLFEGEFRIQSGDGPELHVFVPPSEATARFAWTEDGAAKSTLERLLGLNSENLDEQGIEGDEVSGFTLINKESELLGHARSVAAEHLAAFADNVMGRVAGIVPSSGMKLVGNMSGASIVVAAAPSAKVSAVHEFPGKQKAISRMAMLPDSARHYILGILPVGIGD